MKNLKDNKNFFTGLWSKCFFAKEAMKYYHQFEHHNEYVDYWGEDNVEGKLKSYEEYLEWRKIPNIDKLKEGIVAVLGYDDSMWRLDESSDSDFSV